MVRPTGENKAVQGAIVAAAAWCSSGLPSAWDPVPAKDDASNDAQVSQQCKQVPQSQWSHQEGRMVRDGCPTARDTRSLDQSRDAAAEDASAPRVTGRDSKQRARIPDMRRRVRFCVEEQAPMQQRTSPAPGAAAGADQLRATPQQQQALLPDGTDAAARYTAGKRYYTEDMPKKLRSVVGWEILSYISLIFYMAVPLHVGIIAVCAATFSWPALFLLLALMGTLLLPSKPLMWEPFLHSAFLKSIRQYFDFSVTLENPGVLGRTAIWAEYPHGVFPLSQLLVVTLNPKRWPGLRVHTVCASVLFRVCVWRHMLGWLGIRPATRRHFDWLLREKGSVKVNPGGIAEMYLLDKSSEVIKIRQRKGFVRIAVDAGVPLLPVYHFGQSRMLKYGPRFLEDVSRRMRMSIGLIFGRWGLPVPFKVPLWMVVGDLVPVRHLPRDHPEFEDAVDEAHSAYMDALSALYHRHRAAYGWADRPLVMV